MLQDVTFALRLIRRSSGFAAAAVVTLALGIGATTAIFTLIDAVLLRPLDIPNPDRVVVLQQRTSYGLTTGFLYKNVTAWKTAANGAAVLTHEYAENVVVRTAAGLSKRTAAFVGAD